MHNPAREAGMKRASLIIPIVLLVLLNACDSGRLPPLSDKQWDSIALTEQVRNKTSEEKLEYWLVTAQPQPDNIDQLEQLLFAQYQIKHVSLPPPYFTVEMYCQCKTTSCC